MTYIKLILFITAILLSVIGGKRLKINAGIIAIGFAFIFGITITGLGVNGVVNLFSARLFVNMFLVTFFFGYATSNGTMLSITKYLFKNFKGAPWLLPLLFFAIPFLMAFAGASTDSILLFLSPIAFAFIIEAGLPPILTSILLWSTCAGTWAPWLTNYATFSSWFGESIGMEAAEEGFTRLFIIVCIINISFMLISYIVLGGWRVKSSVKILEEEKIEITKEQKTTLYIILCVITILILPTLIQLIIPNPVTEWMKNNLTIQVLSALGIIAMHITKTANTNDVMKNQIPWGLIIMVCGMAMLMGEAESLGVTDAIKSLLESEVLPTVIVVPFIAAICGFLSIFVSGSVITPLIIALAPALVSYGISGAAIVVASQMGMIATSISPYSMGGAICITGCPEKYSSKVANQQLLLAIIMGIIVTLLAVFGVFG
ncbi:SLC13 family permease [Parablautia sp. Marseille-Q6255]|uniref:SLC13 family permease n=1 Tax=Parablautia sp. Marseille-Q6255 TaxID=3039593 RepID=UPI0024BBEDE9|nr:SLC13 family permease [Parablautia sp. Marseille-Q6255]